MKKINIAIDGFSGTGKSSTARLVAKKLGYTYIDTGAMYRASTYYFLMENIDVHSEKEVTENLAFDLAFINQRINLNGVDVEDNIRSQKVNEKVSITSSIPSLRKKLVKQQRMIGENKGVVMDGRDIGTQVFPEAELKLFLTANIHERAKRRQLELREKGIEEPIDQIKSNLQTRDELDSNRKESPLRKAEDAILIDTTSLTLNEQVEKIVKLAKEIINGN